MTAPDTPAACELPGDDMSQRGAGAIDPAHVRLARRVLRGGPRHPRQRGSRQCPPPGQPKGEPGGDIAVFGGPRFAHSLIRHRLVDEYRLTVHPIALGGGSALMHGLPEPQRFELVSSAVYTDGSTVQVLRPGGRDG